MQPNCSRFGANLTTNRAIATFASIAPRGIPHPILIATPSRRRPDNSLTAFWWRYNYFAGKETGVASGISFTYSPHVLVNEVVTICWLTF